MNNDTPFTTVGDEPIEARIVAWVLGEASGFEAAELERLCEERPELLLFRRRMMALHGLLTEAETAQPGDGWKLPPEKRKPLDEISGQEKVVNLEDAKEKRIRRAGLKAFFAIAACVVLAIVVLQLVHPIWIRQTIHPPEKKVDFMPAGSIVDREEDGSYSYGGGAGEAYKPLTTPLPSEQIEGTPKPIIVPNLETPANGPAGHSSMAVSEKKSKAPASRLMNESNRRVFAAPAAENEASKDAPADPFADEQPDSSVAASAAEPAASKSRARIIPPPAGARVFAEGASSNFAIPEPGGFSIPEPGENFGEMSGLSSLGGSAMSGGLGGSGSGRGYGEAPGGVKGGEHRRKNEEDSMDREKGSGQDARATVARASRPEPSSPSSIDGKVPTFGDVPVVGFTGELAEDGKDSTHDKIPTWGDVPVTGKLFSDGSDKQKELQVPKITTRSVGDDFNGTVNYGSPIAAEAGKAGPTVTTRSGDVANTYSIDAVLNNPNQPTEGLKEVESPISVTC